MKQKKGKEKDNAREENQRECQLENLFSKQPLQIPWSALRRSSDTLSLFDKVFAFDSRQWNMGTTLVTIFWCPAATVPISDGLSQGGDDAAVRRCEHNQ